MVYNMYIILYLLLGISLLQFDASDSATALSNPALRAFVIEDSLQVAETRRRLQLFRFPTEAPISAPSGAPSSFPTQRPTESPSKAPVSQQHPSPVADPQSLPVTAPVTPPQSSPVVQPQSSPLVSPQSNPVANPQPSPVAQPQPQPQTSPTLPIFFQPSSTQQPVAPVTYVPSSTLVPTNTNTLSPTPNSTLAPSNTNAPSFSPSLSPTVQLYPVMIFNAHYKIDNIGSSSLNDGTRSAIVQSIVQATFPRPSSVVIEHYLLLGSDSKRGYLRTSESSINLLALSNYTVGVILVYNLVDFPEDTDSETFTRETIAGIKSSVTSGELTHRLRENSFGNDSGSLSIATASSVTVNNNVQTVTGGASAPNELTHDEMAAIVVCSVFFACIVLAGIAFRLYPEIFITHETASQEREDRERDNQSNVSSHPEFPPIPDIVEFKDNPLTKKLSGSPMSPLSPASLVSPLSPVSPEQIVSPSTAMMPVLISSFYAVPTPEPTPEPSPEPLETITEGEQGQESDFSDKEKISVLESIREEEEVVEEEVDEEEPPITDNN
jgi:hypothetical protein